MLSNTTYLVSNKKLEINDPRHCLSNLVCRSKTIIPEEVKKFQSRIQEKQKKIDKELLEKKLGDSYVEKKILENKVKDLKKKGIVIS